MFCPAVNISLRTVAAHVQNYYNTSIQACNVITKFYKNWVKGVGDVILRLNTQICHMIITYFCSSSFLLHFPEPPKNLSFLSLNLFCKGSSF